MVGGCFAVVLGVRRSGGMTGVFWGLVMVVGSFHWVIFSYWLLGK